MPEGAVGPTIIVGGGPPIGPHMRTAPGPRTKERKGKTKAGFVLRLATKGKGIAEKAADANDILECVWKALPKGRRWQIQKADFVKQKAEGRTARPADRVDTSKAPKIDLGFLGLDGQSAIVPGMVNTMNPRYAEPFANHIQPLSPQAKAAAVYRYASEIDLDAAVKCMAANEIEDRLIGAVGDKLGKAGARMGKLVGLGTGPTF
jgi:hypothetical protein